MVGKLVRYPECHNSYHTWWLEVIQSQDVMGIRNWCTRNLIDTKHIAYNNWRYFKRSVRCVLKICSNWHYSIVVVYAHFLAEVSCITHFADVCLQLCIQFTNMLFLQIRLKDDWHNLLMLKQKENENTTWQFMNPIFVITLPLQRK